MSELLSQRAFAKHIGRSHVWVGKLVKQGKLPLVDGKIPVNEGMAAYEASQQLGYEANRENAEKQRNKAKTNKPSQKNRPKAKEPTTSIPDDDEPLPTTGSGITQDKVSQQFNRAKLAEKTFQAKLRELEWKEKQGHLIPKEVVEQDAAQTAEELRGLLFAIPARIAPLCEGRPARDIEATIDEAINDALGALKKSRFTGR